MLFTNHATHREYESPILMMRDELGIRMVDLCREVGVGSGIIYSLAYGTTWPVYMRDWTVKPYVTKLVDILHTTLEDAFPLFFCKIRAKQTPVMDLYTGDFTLRNGDIWEREHEMIFMRDILEGAWKHLTRREQEVITLRYFKDMTLDEAGNKLGICREGIRIHEQKALKKMRNPKYTGIFEWSRS